MRKLLKRKVAEQNSICAICQEEFTDYTTLCRTTKIPEQWEARGEMTIRTTSGRFTGGATLKKDQPESPTDGRSAFLNN